MAINLKKLSKIVLFSSLLTSSLSFFACKTEANYHPETDDYASVTILISNNELQSQSPEINSEYTSAAKARTATPVLPDTITYTLSATGTPTGSSTPQTITSGTDSQSDTSFPGQKKYMLKLPAGVWTVTATGNTNGQPVLFGTSSQFTVASHGTYEEIVPVYFISDEGDSENPLTGSINLVIDTTDTNIHHLIISGTNNNNLDKQFNVTEDTTSSPGETLKIIRIEASGILARNYYPTLTFYNDSGAIVTIIKETLNIRSNLTTDTWFKTGATLYLKEKTSSSLGEADFVLTKSVIDILENNTFYVKGANAQSTLITGTGNDSHDGSRVNPYLTINAAIKRINELNNVNFDANADDETNHSRKSFRIICDGQIGSTSTTSNITIQPQHNLNLSIESINSSAPAVITTPLLTLAEDQTTNISISNLNLKGDIALQYGNLKLKSVSLLPFETDSSEGKLTYSGGQLTIGGSTSCANGITIAAANKKVLLDSAITATSQTKISVSSSISSSYPRETTILEGAGSASDSVPYNDISTTDLAKFIWANPSTLTGNSDYFALRLKNVDGKQKAVLEKTDFTITAIPIYDDITFVLTDYNPSNSSPSSTPPKYDYNISGYTESEDQITGTITIKMYVKKGSKKLKQGSNTIAANTSISLDSLSLTLFGEAATAIAPTSEHPCQINTVTETSGDTSSDYSLITLTATNIRPGTYLLKMSAVIDGIPYSQQSAAIYASLGAS